MKSKNIPVITIVASLAALGGMALAVQDEYTVQVPGGSRSLSSRDTKTGGLSLSVRPQTC
jgi:hypothetical protein